MSLYFFHGVIKFSDNLGFVVLVIESLQNLIEDLDANLVCSSVELEGF